MSALQLPPRQRMINMMYLVLTAILALNISKEVINAFVLVNNSVERTTANTNLSNEMINNKFIHAMKLDSVKVAGLYKQSKTISEESHLICNEIESLKKRLINEAEGNQLSAPAPLLQDVQRKDDYSTTSRIMCGNSELGKGAAAEKLRTKLFKFKSNIVYILSKQNDTAFINDLNRMIDTNDPLPESIMYKEDNKTTWEMANFYDNPIVASITLLSKMQADIKQLENKLSNSLYDKIREADYPIDRLQAQAVAQSNYVLLGQPFQASIFLSAFNSTSNPRIVVDNRDIAVSNGVANYNTTAQREGWNTIRGVIKVKNPKTNLDEDFPFSTKFLAAKPAAVISPTSMNIIYIGLDNPIAISSPGIPNEKLNLTCSGGGLSLKKISEGQYIANATTQDRNAKISMSTSMNGEQVMLGSQSFRVKRVPDPIVTLSGKKSGSISRAALNATTAVVPLIENFEFDTYFTIQRYRCMIIKNKDVFELDATSGNFTPEMKRLFDKLRPGDKILISDVYAAGPGGQRHIPGATFTVN